MLDEGCSPFYNFCMFVKSKKDGKYEQTRKRYIDDNKKPLL